MNGKLQRIAVLVSCGRHPVSGAARYSRNDAAALETGRMLAERHRAQCDVLHAGDAGNPALEEYLALGASRVEVLACSEADDSIAALAARVAGYDLVLTGTRAEGAFDSGMLPYQLAHALGYPLVGAAVDVEIDGGSGPASVGDAVASRCVDNSVALATATASQQSGKGRTAVENAVAAQASPPFGDNRTAPANPTAPQHPQPPRHYARIRQFLPKGVRRRVAVALPAVIAIHPLASVVPRYAYARLRAGAVTQQPANAAPTSEYGQWTIAPANARPVRFAAPEKRSGHARMLSATTTESRGGSVVIDGTSVAKAQVMLEYLREHQLIDY
jgi:electron transfer flavoprotein beta subunit